MTNAGFSARLDLLLLWPDLGQSRLGHVFLLRVSEQNRFRGSVRGLAEGPVRCFTRPQAVRGQVATVIRASHRLLAVRCGSTGASATNQRHHRRADPARRYGADHDRARAEPAEQGAIAAAVRRRTAPDCASPSSAGSDGEMSRNETTAPRSPSSARVGVPVTCCCQRAHGWCCRQSAATQMRTIRCFCHGQAAGCRSVGCSTSSDMLALEVREHRNPNRVSRSTRS